MVQPFFINALVAPYVGAWNETIPLNASTEDGDMSHPMWVRGLKHIFANHKPIVLGRTLCGCVD